MLRDFQIIVSPGQRKERLDVFLTRHVENATRHKVQKAISSGTVLVDGRTVRASHRVAPGETIQVHLPGPRPVQATPEAIPLRILYEDADVIVVEKPAGMVTHPAHGHYSGTLVNALLYHCGALATTGDALRPGIVHRLDKDTSGLLVVAKHESAHAKLARQFSKRTILREYQAIVWGTFRKKSGIIETDIGRSKSDRKKMSVVVSGKHAVTEYEVIGEFEYLSLLRLKLHTGRTHQIRVHLAHIGHPVFGDPAYNGRHIVAGPGTRTQREDVQSLLKLLPRQALHARTIGFVHPATGVMMEFESDLPADMLDVLSRLTPVEHAKRS